MHLNSWIHHAASVSICILKHLRGLDSFVFLLYCVTSGSAVVRLKERSAALGHNLKIGESSEAVPRAARKCFDFIRIFNKAFGSGKQVAELRFPRSA